MKKLQSIHHVLLILSTLGFLTGAIEAVGANRGLEIVPSTPSAIAQTGRTQRLQFAPGTTSTVVENSLVRGTRDTYILGARAGQVMTVNLTSLEDNAVFAIIAPDGKTMLSESYSWQGFLPGNTLGDYKIIVVSTRGNATYTLDIEIF